MKFVLKCSYHIQKRIVAKVLGTALLRSSREPTSHWWNIQRVLSSLARSITAECYDIRFKGVDSRHSDYFPSCGSSTLFLVYGTSMTIRLWTHSLAQKHSKLAGLQVEPNGIIVVNSDFGHHGWPENEDHVRDSGEAPTTAVEGRGTDSCILSTPHWRTSLTSRLNV